MQIQLKQSEIVTALKQYIAQQGIDLAGKDVIITFTAGRKETGITADLAIEEIEIPGFTNAGDEPIALHLVPAGVVQPAAAAVMEAATAEVAAVAGVPSAELVEKVAKSASLFN